MILQSPDQVVSILEVVAPMIVGVVFIIASGAVAVTWIQKRSRQAGAPDTASQRRIEERLDHLTSAVDAIAVEVERISEGQRFTTKLLAENQPAQYEGAKSLRLPD